MKHRLGHTIFRSWLSAVLAAFSALFWTSCSKDRIMDRHDERAMSMTEDHYNLYNGKGAAKTVTTIQERSSLPVPEAGEIFCRYKNLSDIEPVDVTSAKFSADYALISVCWKKSPPVLRFWTRFANVAKWVDLTIPLSDANSWRIIDNDTENDDGAAYAAIVPIRQHTYMPWIIQDDYEIFKVEIEERMDDDGNRSMVVVKIDQLTDDRVNDIQPILSPDKKSIVYVSVDGSEQKLMRMDVDGADPKIIAENASLPYFIPDSGKLLFVKNEKSSREFRIYDPETGEESPASDEQLEIAISTIPYASLKSKYMFIDNFARRPTPDKGASPEKTYTLEQLVIQGLRSSPVVLKDYFKYESSISSTSATLYNEGPDFFSSGTVIPKENIFTEETDYPIGDRIATENFLRLITGLSVPIIPNLPLRFATYDANKCEEEVARQHLHKTINDYISDMVSAYCDAVEAELLLPLYREKVVLNRKRLRRNRASAKLGGVLKAREIFAENMLAAAESDYNAAVEKLIHSKFAIAALLGEKITSDFNVAIPDLSWNAPPLKIPALSFFQAQGQINHPDLQRLNAMIMKAAAIRDMGPPARRIDAVKVNVSYGLGFDNWSKLVDDFLQVGITAMAPIRLPILDNAYYDKWTAEINSMRQEKYKTQAELKRDIHGAYMDIDILRQSARATQKRLAFQKENFRLSRVYAKLGRVNIHEQEDDKWMLNYPIIAKLEMLNAKIRLATSKCEFFRRTAKLYAAGGIASSLLPAIFAATKASSGKSSLRSPNTKSIYLWESLKTVTDKTEREKFLDTCSTAGINRVYCFVSRTPGKALYLKKYDLEFSYFLDQCAEKGIKVYALMGNSEWLAPSYQQEITALLDNLNKFDKEQSENESAEFAGLKIDVEPHALPGWHNGTRGELVARYLSTLDFVRKHYAGVLGVDIPYTYNGIPAKGDGDLVAQIAKKVDLITVMAYLNSKSAILAKTAPIFERDDISVPVEIALETAPLDAPDISFHGVGHDSFKTICSSLKSDFSRFKTFSGMAIHDYTSFSAMLGGGEGKH